MLILLHKLGTTQGYDFVSENNGFYYTTSVVERFWLWYEDKIVQIAPNGCCE